MFVDAKSIPSDTVIETDVCIVGAGAAGITVARELINSALRVILLESGDMEFDQSTQALYAGSNVGRKYFSPDDVALRLRFFGGSTNHWEGWCALPDALDFEPREGVPYSGWPFSRAYLEPWYRRAQAVLQLGPYGYELSDWGLSREYVAQPFDGPHFNCQVLQVSPPTRFGPTYADELRQASRLIVHLNANGLRFESNEAGHNVAQLVVGVLPEKLYAIRSRIYVLAAGGIENARLLLLSDKEGGAGLGNDHDLVGRFFMVHLEYPGGIIALADTNRDLSFATGNDGRTYNRLGVPRRFVSYVSLSEDTRRKRHLPNLRIFFSPTSNGLDQAGRALQDLRSAMRDIFIGPSESEGGHRRRSLWQNLRTVTRDVYYGANSIGRYVQYGPQVLLVHCSSEQLPNPDSRVELESASDAFGLRKVRINWQLIGRDKQGVLAGHKLLGSEVGRVGFGRFQSWVTDDDVTWLKEMFGDQHTIGTTRMHRDPKFGVVDQHCRVHGVRNLYVAGSSVFPTEGVANPTLTIVALALRLAEHIKEDLS